MTTCAPEIWRRHGAPMLLALAALLLLAGTARAGQVTVAVAANFAEPMETLAPRFEAETGHEVTLVTGSTGKLYAQIVHGAPFDVLLAADMARPLRLAEEGLADPDSRFTYAVGGLTLWSADPEAIGQDCLAALRQRDFRHLAIANPELAPYGEAAREVLTALGLWQAVQAELVRGENIGQTFQLVATGNAELGFVARAQVLSPRNQIAGSRWDVPGELHAPIRQDAILLHRAIDPGAARAFLAFLRSPEAQAVIEGFGYGAIAS